MIARNTDESIQMTIPAAKEFRSAPIAEWTRIAASTVEVATVTVV